MNKAQDHSYNRIEDIKLHDGAEKEDNDLWLRVLLVDLLHWTDERVVDFYDVLELAMQIYFTEVKGAGV